MSKYESERAAARKILQDRLLEIDQISDEEIEQHKAEDKAVRFTLLRLSKLTFADRAFRQKMKEPTNAADADKFLYGDDGLPN